MSTLSLLLISLFTVVSGLGASSFHPVRKPVIVDDRVVNAPLVRQAMPTGRSTFILPPGTVIDSSYYDWQANGSLNRRIWVNADGSVHATHMVSPDQAFVERGMTYYYANEFGDPFVAYGYVGTFRDGFGSLSAYPTTYPLGAIAVIATHDFGAVESFAFVDAFQGLGAFTALQPNPAGMVVWPKPTVNSDGSITIVGTLMNEQVMNGITHNVAWDRTDSTGGFTQTWTWLGQDPADWSEAAMEFPSVASGANGRAGIVVGDFAADVHFFESTDSGLSYAETLITNAAQDTIGLPPGPDSSATVFLPWINTDIGYAGEEPHIVWTAAQAAQVGGIVLYDLRTRILHWSPSTGIDTVVVASYQGTYPAETETYVSGGSNHLSIDWPQIGVSPDGGLLYVLYVAFDPNDVDPGNGIGLGDIWGTYSIDNGESWSGPINLSNPGGAYPGTDDRYPSLSPVNYEAALEPGKDAYFVYQSDNTGGSFVQGEESANWDYYLFSGVDFDPVGIGKGGGGTLPRGFELHQNHPNPFNPSTTLSFDVPGIIGMSQPVSLKIYDLRGRCVRSLVDSELPPGTHRVVWDGRNDRHERVGSGFYLYTLRSGDRISTRKMAVLK